MNEIPDTEDAVEEYEVNFLYYSEYEDEKENKSIYDEETFYVKSLNELFAIIGVETFDEELFDTEFNETLGENSAAESSLISSGREPIWVKDSTGKVVWSEDDEDE